jgi:hypothetical protein
MRTVLSEEPETIRPSGRMQRTLVTRENPVAVAGDCIPDAHCLVIRAGDDSAVGEDGEIIDTTLVTQENPFTIST